MNSAILLGVLVALSVLFIMGAIARLYRKAGPHEALVVYGHGGTKVIKGRGIVILPVIQTVKSLSLELMSFDVAPQQDRADQSEERSREHHHGGGAVSDEDR